MQANIKWLKLILPLYQAWFWLGVWLLFYLRVTDYAGVGFLEASMFFIGVVMEIPTGAFSDLFGKKWTLVIAYSCYAIGNTIMAFSQSYQVLMFSVFILVFGTAMYSGTAEALLYDSLKDTGREQEYERHLSRVKTLTLLTLAISSLLGGFLYSWDIKLPFLATTAAGVTGLVLVLLVITEPASDSKKFTLRNYLKQNKDGFIHLFQSIRPSMLSELVLIASLTYIFDMLVETAYAMEIGIDEKGLGIVFAALFLLSSASTFIYEHSQAAKYKGLIKLSIMALFIATSIASPYIGLTLGLLAIMGRHTLAPLIDVIASEEINQRIESRYRATAISSFELLKKLPYIAIAYFIGDLIDQYSASRVMVVLAVAYLLTYVLISVSGSIKVLSQTVAKQA